MKEVIYGEELKKVIISAIDIICDAVASTLGPTGNNVLINNDELSPFITNDGVTIAKSIENEDIRINTVLEIVKEASLKTNELVGDGTTTTLILLQSIYKNGLEEINNGKNPIILKSELEDSLNIIISRLYKLSKKTTKKDLEKIAITSCNNKEMGKFIANIFNNIKTKNGILLNESNTDETYYEIKKGYNLEIDIPSLCFKNKDEINLSNVYILIIKGYLSSLEDISEIINEGIIRNKNIIIFLEEFNEEINQELMLYNVSNKKNVYLFKIQDYGSHKEDIFSDISFISDCDIVNINYQKAYFNNFGTVDKVIITKKEVNLLTSKDLSERINKLKKEFYKENNTYEKDFISSRICKLSTGVANIYVGGKTKTEVREKIMRYEDALCALEVSKNGVILGEGISFLKISNELKINSSLKKALNVPFRRIMINSGKDYKEIEEKIKNYNYEKIYNINDDIYENIINTSIIDPTLVCITAIKNAVSISSMLLTTNYLVINEKLNSITTDL